MSNKEFDRLDVLPGVRPFACCGVCELLGLKRRQVLRVLTELKHGGAAGLFSKRRAGRGKNHLTEAYRDLALLLVRERYADFGPTSAAAQPKCVRLPDKP